MSTRFHIVIHPRPGGVAAGDAVACAGGACRALAVDSTTPWPPFPFSYEELERRLSRLPRMFCEPDGSFVWVGPAARQWQLDGLIVDDGRSVVHLELKGHCCLPVWQQLLQQLDWPARPLMVQVVQAGLFLAEEVFRDKFVDRPVGA